jgi:hypothetical protein
VNVFLSAKTFFYPLFISAGLGLLLFSCRQEPDPVSPKINVFFPSAGNIFNVGDTIHLSAEFSDNSALHSLRVTLIDEEQRPCLPAISVESPSNPFTLTADYPIDNLLLESGTYELQFQASDGVNTTNVYIKTGLAGIPKEFLYPLILTSQGSNMVNAYAFTEPASWNKIYSQQGDFAGSALNSAYRQLYVSGSSKSHLNAWSLQENRVLWTVPIEYYPHGHWFESVNFEESMLFVSYYEGPVRGFDRTGNMLLETEIRNPYYPVRTCVSGKLIAAALKNKADHSTALGFYYRSSGKLKSLKSPAPDIQGMAPLDENRLLTFGNKDGDMVISLYDTRFDEYSELKRMPGESAFSVASLNNDNCFISGLHQLYWYRYSSNSLVDFGNPISKAHLACEPISQEIYAGSGKNLFVYSFPDGILRRSIPLPDSLLDIELLYTK